MNLELGALTIKLDVLIVQIINIGILFWLFKKFAGDMLANAVIERRNLINKLNNADKEYATMIEKAHLEKQQIIDDAQKHKQKLYTEATLLAEQRKGEILNKASKEADIIIENAQIEGKKIEKELVEKREDGVKATTQTVVKKLINSDKELNAMYIQQLIKEAESTRSH